MNLAVKVADLHLMLTSKKECKNAQNRNLFLISLVTGLEVELLFSCAYNYTEAVIMRTMARRHFESFAPQWQAASLNPLLHNGMSPF